MAERHEPLCAVKGCPAPTDDDWHRCFVCGNQAIEHQHFPKKSLRGAKIVAALCHYHHDRIDKHHWREGIYTHPDGSIRYYVQNAKGEEQCERIIEAALTSVTISTPSTVPVFAEGPIPGFKLEPILPAEEPSLRGKPVEPPEPQETALAPRESLPAVKDKGTPIDLSQYSDEQLATLFAWADKQQKDAFLTKCQVVHAYRMRHEPIAGESWLEAAYEVFHVSRRTLYAYSNVWEICVTSDTHIVDEIGPLTDSRSLMQFIGRKSIEQGRAALEAAIAYIAEFGEPPTVSALVHRLQEEGPQDNLPIPAGQFATIIADPPWSYRDILPQKQGAASNYACLSVADIIALPVNKAFAENAHLYLWVTTGMIEEGYQVARAWGFVPKSFLTWHKTGRMGLGRWFRNDTEHVIFAVRGELKLKRKDARNIFSAPVRRHSEKPEEFIALVESCSPSPYLELFSRKMRPGWTTWGDEVGEIPTQLALSKANP